MPQIHNPHASTRARLAGLDPASRFSTGGAVEGSGTPDQVRGDESGGKPINRGLSRAGGHKVRRFASMRIGQTAVCAGALFLASCAAAQEPTRPSILPELAKMQSLFACLEAAPLGSKMDADRCAKSAGISMVELPNEPKSAAEFKPLIVATWFFFDQDTTKRLSASSLPTMIEYAKCVETHAYADNEFSSRTKIGVINAEQRAEFACMAHPLSLRSLGTEAAAKITNMRERALANLLAKTAIKYALEANGWFPDEMRPCIRYLDGRPPSVGCSLNPQPKLKPPPLPSGYRPQ